MDTEACERLDFDIDKLRKSVRIGYAFLYAVKEYKSQEEFNKDKQKHFSIIRKYFEGYKYGFLVKDAKMFKLSIPYSGKLGFFEIDNSILVI
jgi:hypothetical protein